MPCEYQTGVCAKIKLMILNRRLRGACSNLDKLLPSHFALSIVRAVNRLAVKLCEQVRGSGVDVELILHRAAHHVPNLDLHCTA